MGTESGAIIDCLDAVSREGREMKIKRMAPKWSGSEKVMVAISDEQLVGEYLKGSCLYNGGALESLEQEVSDLRAQVAELLVALHGKEVVDLCEDKDEVGT
jgi:hypothetical protein